MGDLLFSHDPRTGETVGSVPITKPEDVPAIVERSWKAFEGWAALGPEGRRPFLRRLRRAVLDEGSRISRVVQSETGKVIDEAYAFDVVTTLVLIDHYVHHAHKYLRRTRGGSWPFVSTRSWTEYEPRGVVGVISPWNYPFFQPAVHVFTALSAGCSVVLKPSDVAPLSGQLFVDVARKAGLPEDLVQVVHGGAETGAALTRAHLGVVAFTGSTRVGRLVAVEAAKNLTPAVLELGGVDGMVVLEDADIRQAAKAAVWGSMTNAGQMCTSVERLYVVDAVYERFLERVRKEFDSVTAGDGSRKDIGPIIYEPQLDTIEAHVADAVEKGATVLRGGKRANVPGGTYYEPTLLTNVNHEMLVIKEETFGPVLPIQRVANAEEALAMVNDSTYGLHGSVWSGDRRRAERFASLMETGTVAINDHAINFVTPTVAFGGVKDSGNGGVFGRDGLLQFCHAKGITEPRLGWATTRLLGAWFPRRRGLGYWKALANVLFRR